MLRRRFTSWLLRSSLAALTVTILYPILRFLSPPDVPEPATRQVEAGLTNDPELIERGFKIVRFGSEPVLLVRVADGDYRAFTAICTHLDCIVEYHPQHSRIWCNCHNGQFDLEGRPVAGPPPRPLEPYRVNLVTDGPGPSTIVISRV